MNYLVAHHIPLRHACTDNSCMYIISSCTVCTDAQQQGSIASKTKAPGTSLVHAVEPLMASDQAGQSQLSIKSVHARIQARVRTRHGADVHVQVRAANGCRRDLNDGILLRSKRQALTP